MSDHSEQKQYPLAEASDAMAVRFERLNVLANAIDNLADENRQHLDLLGVNGGVAPDLQSAVAFILRELRESEQELDQILAGGEA